MQHEQVVRLTQCIPSVCRLGYAENTEVQSSRCRQICQNVIVIHILTSCGRDAPDAATPKLCEMQLSTPLSHFLFSLNPNMEKSQDFSIASIPCKSVRRSSSHGQANRIVARAVGGGVAMLLLFLFERFCVICVNRANLKKEFRSLLKSGDRDRSK